MSERNRLRTLAYINAMYARAKQEPLFSYSWLACSGICPACLGEASCIESVESGLYDLNDPQNINERWFTGCPECRGKMQRFVEALGKLL